MSRFRTWQQEHPLRARIAFSTICLYLPLLAARLGSALYSDSWSTLHTTIYWLGVVAAFMLMVFASRRYALRPKYSYRIPQTKLERILSRLFIASFVLSGDVVKHFRESLETNRWNDLVFDIALLPFMLVVIIVWDHFSAKPDMSNAAPETLARIPKQVG